MKHQEAPFEQTDSEGSDSFLIEETVLIPSVWVKASHIQGPLPPSLLAPSI